MTLPEGFLRIPNTTHYAYYPITNLVMNLKTEGVLTPQWQGGSLRTKIVDKDGKPFYFPHDLFDRDPKPTLTREYVLQDEGAKIPPDYPRYAVTELGVIYCIDPKKRGRKANCIHIVDTHEHQGWEQASLATPEGKTRRVRVDKLVSELWS